MKRSGSSIIFRNRHNQVLLFLRDDISEIPYPNMWDLPGGHVEPDETPFECIVREMMEEIETDVNRCTLLKVYDFPDRYEHIFFMEMDVDAASIPLHEGQCLRWFSANELPGIPIAFGFDLVLENFFDAMGPDDNR